ncbi:hypothetical protein [Nocardia sp. NPDC058480]|uniref:hypothetical protein n=1 Tax=unclassified Nocardia TaxID=2637762 RepID=UPI003653BDED
MGRSQASRPVVLSARVVPVPMPPVELGRVRRALRVDRRKVDLVHRRATPLVGCPVATHPAWGRDRRGRAMRLVDNSLRVRGRSSHGGGQGLRPVGHDRVAVPVRDSRAMCPAHNNLRVDRVTRLAHHNIRARVDHGQGVRSVVPARNKAADRRPDADRVADLVHSKPADRKRDTDRAADSIHSKPPVPTPDRDRAADLVNKPVAPRQEAADPVRNSRVDRTRDTVPVDRVRSKAVDPEPGKTPVLGRSAGRAM